jgi:hypothetical protein
VDYSSSGRVLAIVVFVNFVSDAARGSTTHEHGRVNPFQENDNRREAECACRRKRQSALAARRRHVVIQPRPFRWVTKSPQADLTATPSGSLQGTKSHSTGRFAQLPISVVAAGVDLVSQPVVIRFGNKAAAKFFCFKDPPLGP